MFKIQHFLPSSSHGEQRAFEPSYSKEKLRIQIIVDTLCPRLCECKAILQEIIWSLTPGRCYKKMTLALAERAVEVTSNISHLLEGAEEIPQLLDNIFQLEQTLRDILVFVQSETQRKLLLRIMFAKDLRVCYFSLDRQLRGLLKPFEHTVKKPLILCDRSLNTTIQEDHPGVASQVSQQDGALAEIVPPNNSSAHHASGSIFPNANNFVVRNGTFYAAHNLVVKKIQDSPQGIVEGTDVFTLGDVLPKKEIYKGRGYRVYSAHSTAKERAVKIKLYEGSCAKDRCLAAASFSRKVMHPNVLHLIGVSPLNSELPFLVFDDSTEWDSESIIASALSKGLEQSLLLGLQTVAGLSESVRTFRTLSGLDYLRTLLYPFECVGLDQFFVSFSHHGNVVISFDPEVLLDETCKRDQPSGVSDGGNELDIFHGLCQKTFDAACKAHYEFQKVQRSDLDELDADHDLDQDQFEEIEVDAGTLLVDTKDSISDVLSALSMSSISSRRPSRKSNSSARRRELVWRSQKNETVSLEEIALQFRNFLLTFSTELGFNHRRGRYTTKTAHRCPGYNRIEITLTPDIASSAIVSHFTPIPHEICPVCKEIVRDAEIFACICGRDDDESIPTIRCSTCSQWHHRPCVELSIFEDQSFVCRRCKDIRVISGHVFVTIHPLLSITKPSPKLKYDVSQPPSTMTIMPNVLFVLPHYLNDLATFPPMPSMIIRCPHLPWTITILSTNTIYVTVRDVFDGIYRSLRRAVLEAEFQCLPSAEARYSVINAYTRRYKRLDDPEARELEKNKGMKRVDFLGERTLFTGLSSTLEELIDGLHVWFLSVS